MRILKIVLLFLLIATIVGSFTAYTFYYKIPKIDAPVSILILGKGGEGHTAPDLTDTIMIGYLNNKSKKTTILSLPRDIWISEIRAKLNTAYHYGGFKMAGSSVTSTVGLPINYIVVIDFSLFKDLINTIGGIDVNVENTFIDNKYPIKGKEDDLCNGDKLYECRYETLDIKSGIQHMDGTLALKFVRSRNAKGDEGTDIAREKRQQKVIEAVRKKLLSSEVLLNFNVIKSLYTVFMSHIETDIDADTIKTLVKFAIESKFRINFLSVPEDKIMVSKGEKKYDKQYVFIPSSGTWKELQEWVKQKI